MDLNFVDPSEAPVPPEEVRIRDVTAEPFPDQRRVKVHIELTPFQQRPTLAVVMLDEEENEIATTSIIETLDPILEFTMHIRRQAPAGEYRLRVAAGYDEEEAPVDVKETTFAIAG